MRRHICAFIFTFLMVTTFFAVKKLDANGPPLLVNVSTDKAVYSAGEVVHIKAEVRESDGVTRVSGASVGIGISPPEGGTRARASPAAEIGIQPGDYFYDLDLAPSGVDGVWNIHASASKAGYTDGSENSVWVNAV